MTANETGEESEMLLQEMVDMQKEIAEELGFHYRCVCVCVCVCMREGERGRERERERERDNVRATSGLESLKCPLKSWAPQPITSTTLRPGCQGGTSMEKSAAPPTAQTIRARD